MQKIRWMIVSGYGFKLLLLRKELITVKMSAGPINVVSVNTRRDELPVNFPIGMKVLLVDDDLTCLQIIRDMLIKCQYEVTACANARKALLLLHADNYAFDLVVTDVYMPEMDGFELLEQIGLLMDVPVVMISGDTRLSLAKAGVMHGACDFLFKPIQMKQLAGLWKHVFKFHLLRKEKEQSDIEERDGHAPAASTVAPATDTAKVPYVEVGENLESVSSHRRKHIGPNDNGGESESSGPLSLKKKRLSWSMQLHKQFVDAVNFLGIDGAVPTRILDVMDVPGVTRENVASHLQKYRLSMKRSIRGSQRPSDNTKESHLPKQDLHSLSASSQIPQLPVAMHNELKNLMMNKQVVLQAPTQGATPVTVGGPTIFGHHLIENQGPTSCFQVWPSNYHCSRDSSSTIQEFNSPQILLPERQLINAQSSLGTSIPSPDYFHAQEVPLLMKRDPVTGGIQSPPTTQAGEIAVPENLNPASLTVVTPTVVMTWNNAVLEPNSQAGQNTVPENLNSASLIAVSPTIMMTGGNNAVVAPNSRADQIIVPGNLNSASLPAVSPIIMMTESNAILAPNSRAGPITVPGSLNSVSLPSVPSTFVMAGNNAVLTNEGSTIPLGNFSISTNPGFMNFGSIVSPPGQSRCFQPANPHLVSRDSLVVPSQSSMFFPAENNLFCNINNSILGCDELMAHLGRRLSPLDIESSSPVQDVGEYLNMEAFDECSNNEDIVNSFSFSEPAPSSLSPYAGGGNVLKVENTNNYTGGQYIFSTSTVPDSAGIQVGGSISSETSGAIGFSANSSRLPSQFGAAETETLGNDLTGHIWIDDNGYIVFKSPWS